jgi:4'-phosphopantetheinyl transferase
VQPADPAVAWHTGATTADAALSQHLVTVLGTGPADVQVGRLCPECGSDRHGRPWARVAEGSTRRTGEVHVSLACAAGYVVTAVSLRGPVGVDVEVVAHVAREWTPKLVLAPGETAASAVEQARCWAAKEAVLKRRGTGLATPMAEVRLVDESGLQDLAAPEGLVAVLAGPG